MDEEDAVTTSTSEPEPETQHKESNGRSRGRGQGRGRARGLTTVAKNTLKQKAGGKKQLQRPVEKKNCQLKR